MVRTLLRKNKLLKKQFLFRHCLLQLPFGIAFNMCFLSQIQTVIISPRLPGECYIDRHMEVLHKLQRP